MTTIVNSPAPTNESNGSNFLIGILALIGFIILFLYFGLPALRNMGPIQLNVPAPQVVIPGKIDVNVKQSK